LELGFLSTKRLESRKRKDKGGHAQRGRGVPLFRSRGERGKKNGKGAGGQNGDAHKVQFLEKSFGTPFTFGLLWRKKGEEGKATGLVITGKSRSLPSFELDSAAESGPLRRREFKGLVVMWGNDKKRKGRPGGKI